MAPGRPLSCRSFAGLLHPTSGHIEIDGRIRSFSNPLEAKRLGIGMVHQHFSLVPSLTVAENLALSQANGGFLLNMEKWSRYLSQKADECGLDIRPDVTVGQLSLGERQRVEIFRLIVEGAKVLILDEPTSILGPVEADLLFDHVRRFASAGHIVFLITHKIHHVRAVGQHLSILRRGRLIKQCAADQLMDDEISELMVGGQLERLSYRRSYSDRPPAAPALEVRDLAVPPVTCPKGLQNVSFSLFPGEVLGIAGISGNGQDELVAALTGGTIYQGSITLKQKGTIENGDVQVGYIPADRRGAGSALSLSVAENLAMRRYCKHPFSTGFLLQKDAIRESAIDQIRRYDIRPLAPAARAGLLSGGNLQKVVIARELEGNPALIIAVNPTAGLDVATVQTVHGELMAKAAGGAGILFVSEDLDELFLVCDRMLVLRNGHVEEIVRVSEVEKRDIGLLMTRGKGVPDKSSNGICAAKSTTTCSTSVPSVAGRSTSLSEVL